MKQVLSVADFATILELVNVRIYECRVGAKTRCYYRDFKDEKDRKTAETDALKALEAEPHYQSLVHLKKSLESLNIEVECPDVEIKEDK